ncbi:MAG TPA: hypothetical protein P5268_06110 [Candidatus Marinimicrobia bacterium]|nr:hypothetical protein [Candidatus Neomarinimicrobiota bacterium]HRS51079.1 hypothetical protein [Candidatus Neomarinimicrobiota bacterium]HRU92585.1 hypothetical protein [Candidatus Neomarinimicrobiota bacterium]
MKKINVYIPVLILIFFFLSCEDMPVTTGSLDVEVIKKMKFAITSKSYTTEQLSVIGTVTNNGSETVYPDWYVEGEFYADSTFKLKLGGDNYRMTFPLEPGVTASWQLIFYSDLYIESDYPHFGIKNLRAFKYKEDE